MASDKEIYLQNGPKSEESRFFVEQVEARLGRRPWTPGQEVSVMRAFAVTLRELFGKERQDAKGK